MTQNSLVGGILYEERKNFLENMEKSASTGLKYMRGLFLKKLLEKVTQIAEITKINYVESNTKNISQKQRIFRSKCYINSKSIRELKIIT